MLPKMTASTLLKKRKAVETTRVGLPSNKVKKSNNASTVQNDSQCQKPQRNRIKGENSKKIAKYSLQKQHTVGSCNSDRTKDLDQLVNSKVTKGVLTPQGEHTTSQTDTTSVRRILKPSRNTCKPVHDCSTNFCTPEVKVTVDENTNNNSSSCNNNTFTSGFNPVSFTVKSSASGDGKSKDTITPNLYTSNAKQSQNSHNLPCETFPHYQSLLSSSGYTNTEDSCRQGNSHHLNEINMGLTPQTNLNRTAYSHSFGSSQLQTGGYSDDSKSLVLNYEKCTADSSLLRPPYYDGWLHSPDSGNWKAANNLLDSAVGSFKPASSFNVSSGNMLFIYFSYLLFVQCCLCTYVILLLFFLQYLTIIAKTHILIFPLSHIHIRACMLSVCLTLPRMYVCLPVCLSACHPVSLSVPE